MAGCTGQTSSVTKMWMTVTTFTETNIQLADLITYVDRLSYHSCVPLSESLTNKASGNQAHSHYLDTSDKRNVVQYHASALDAVCVSDMTVGTNQSSAYWNT